MEKLLPNGTVVRLAEGTKKLMILGRLQRDGEGNRFDYCACLYPEGYQDGNRMILFNDSDIDVIYQLGLQDEEEFKFQVALDELRQALANAEKASSE